jgi:nucleotide-binding universal stress UspA family protein
MPRLGLRVLAGRSMTMPQFTEMRRPVLWDDVRPRSRPSVSPRTIVLGYDGSEGARSGAFRAAEAAGRGGHILVVTAAPPPDAPELEQDGAPASDPERLLQEAKALLGGEEAAVTTRLAEGDPVEALIAAASDSDADLIVVGARGRSFLARTLRGSVAERLVARAPCSVLVAR